MKFGLLGPFWVVDGEGEVDLGPPQRRAVLAVLACSPNRVVSTDRLIDSIWGEDGSSQALGGLQAHISRLRKLLGGDRIGTRQGGYVLRVEPDELDVEVFERLAAEGRQRIDEGSDLAGSELLEAALAVWRGEPLAEFANTDWAQTEIGRLNEIRLSVTEDWNDSQLRLGHHRNILGELDRLAHVHPERERLWGQLITALYRSHRQVEALREYSKLRSFLADELGIDPSAYLQDLELAILTQDPQLQAAPLTAGRHNLPVQLTSFVGRTQELAELVRLLAEARLITLTGPGGVGKTRLALQVASEVTDRYPDGVWFVELAAISTADMVATAVRNALGLPEQPGRNADETLEELARTKTILIVIDNCEHLLDAVMRLVERMLRAGTGSRVLATSREPLALPGETVVPVPPLPLPPELSEGVSVRENPAVALFLDRASAQAGFRSTDQQLITVADVCRRLDGLPLALELAAARLRGLSLEDVADRLENRFRLLTSGRRSALPRQQTLEGAIAWSYDLLEKEERRLFARLGVFADTFDLESAEATAGYPPLNEFDVADLLARLVDRSMVTRVGSEQVSRYRLLESLRLFALARLTDFEDETVPRHRLAQHFRKWAVANASEMRGSGQIDLYKSIDRELPNIRSAIGWSLNHEDIETAADLVGSLWWHWQVRGRWREGLDVLGEVVAAGPPFGVSHARLLSGMGMFATEIDLYDEAQRHFDTAEDMARRGGYQTLVEEVLTNRAFLDISRGNVDTARNLLDNVLASSKQGGRFGNAAAARFVQGRLSAGIGAPDAAVELAEALSLAEQAGDVWLTAAAAAFLGRTLILSEDFDQGIRLLERGRADFQAVGDPTGEALIATSQVIGEIRTGRFAAAQSSLAIGLELSELVGSPAQDYVTMVWVAAWLEHLGRHLDAARLCGGLNSIVASIGFKSEHAEQEEVLRVEAACREVMGISRFEMEYRVGEGLDRYGTLAFARKVLADASSGS